MRHDPDLDRQHIRDLRRRIAERIEADIARLDALDGDTDNEPSLGSSEVGPFDQSNWAAGEQDDREDENEHDGDVCGEPHDPEEDAGANEPESAAYLCQCYGYGYFPVIGRRRA